MSWLISVRTWIKLAAKYIIKILGSPQAEAFMFSLIEAVTGIAVSDVKDLWNLIYTLAVKAEALFPGSGRGDEKYAYLLDELKKAGVKAKAFTIDYILHNVLADMLARANKNEPVPAKFSYVPSGK